MCGKIGGAGEVFLGGGLRRMGWMGRMRGSERWFVGGEKGCFLRVWKLGFRVYVGGRIRNTKEFGLIESSFCPPWGSSSSIAQHRLLVRAAKKMKGVLLLGYLPLFSCP